MDEESAYYNNIREFGDFVEGLSLDQFIAWVYRVYSVSALEDCYDSGDSAGGVNNFEPRVSRSNT